MNQATQQSCKVHAVEVLTILEHRAEVISFLLFLFAFSDWGRQRVRLVLCLFSVPVCR